MLRLIFLFILLITQFFVWSQPTDQDCLGAIPVCQSTYSQANSYSGTGNYPNEIPTGGGCPGNCMSNGELNDVWYIFTVQTSGLLSFVITPNSSGDDYDWVVYSLNDYRCQDIITYADQMQVSCNWSGTPGSTGANGGSSNNCQGANGSPFNSTISVSAGETYVLNISNYSSTQYGYLLDFTASTAVIFDDVAPVLSEVETDDLECGVSELTFSFSENVKCSSVQYQDFSLDGPGGPYTLTTVSGEACEVGGSMEKTYTIQFTPPIFEGGTFSLDIIGLAFIQDACGNNAIAQSLEFDVDLDSPIADAGEDIDIPFLGSTVLDGSVIGGSGNFSYLWTPAEKLIDPSLEDPTTVSLDETTEFTLTVTDNSSTCQSSDKVTVNIVGGEMNVTTTSDPAEVCAGDPAVLFANPSGGSGDYSFSWTSSTGGFTSDLQSPTAFPTETTTYTVEVDDGYSTIEGQVTVSVLPKPIADAGPDQVINVGTATYLDGSGSGGLSPYTYEWSPASLIDGPSAIEDPKTKVLNAPQNFTLQVTDANLCPSDQSVVLINAAGGELAGFPQADPYEICFGETATLIANATGGGGSYSFEWTSSQAGWSATGDSIQVTPDSTTTYFVEINDGFTTANAYIPLPVHPLPVIDLVPDGYIEFKPDTLRVCVRDTVILDAGHESNPPNMDYLWSNNLSNRYNLCKTNGNWFDNQTHGVTVRNPVTSCSSSDSITIIFDFYECTIGIGENEKIDVPVSVIPNPNNGIFSVKTEKGFVSLKFILLNSQGQSFKESEFHQIPPGGWEETFDISKLPDGIYILSIIADGHNYFIKIVKN